MTIEKGAERMAVQVRPGDYAENGSIGLLTRQAGDLIRASSSISTGRTVAASPSGCAVQCPAERRRIQVSGMIDGDQSDTPALRV